MSASAAALVKPSTMITGSLARWAVLNELRRLMREQTRTNAILSLDLDDVATAYGLSRSDVQDNLAELLELGYAQPYADSMDQGATDGAAKITGTGLRELERMEQPQPIAATGPDQVKHEDELRTRMKRWGYKPDR
jgi:hypothetical protein